MPVLNDVQSRLNSTPVLRVVEPEDPADVSEAISRAIDDKNALCPAGTLHSMGGQQFKHGGISLSSAALTGIGPLDAESRTVWVQSGVTWSRLVNWLQDAQQGRTQPLSIIQKQTGADHLSLGGALSSNIHGRVLGRRPIVGDIHAFYLTTAQGRRVLCSRRENAELFGLAVGGYGLFGFIDSIQLKLQERQRLVRRVREIPLEEVIPSLEEQTRLGATYGDFQYKTDETSKDFMAAGIMSTYSPAEESQESSGVQLGLSPEDWSRLYVLAHTDKARAYDEYASHYLQTDGQLYWSDDHQFSPYLTDAGDLLNRELGWQTYASLMISELYVPRDNLVEFMSAARKTLAGTEANLIYGTIRLIQAETETFLRWAKQDYACVIFNLLVEHSSEGIRKAGNQFQGLIDCALNWDGAFYLTYHRWARKDQVERAYPQFPEFLAAKLRHDPQETFSSDWYTHHQEMFG